METILKPFLDSQIIFIKSKLVSNDDTTLKPSLIPWIAFIAILNTIKKCYIQHSVHRMSVITLWSNIVGKYVCFVILTQGTVFLNMYLC